MDARTVTRPTSRAYDNHMKIPGDADRRTVLKTLGAGVAASSGLTGIGAASDRGKGNEEHLDPLWGYTGIVEDLSDGFPDDEEFPPQIRPDHTVDLHIGENRPVFHFHPVGLQVEPGDIVMFQLHSPDHSITAYHERFRGGQRVPDDVGPFSSPVLPVGGYWFYRFGEDGVYDLMCAPHELMGMAMRIVAHDGGATPSAPTEHGPFPANVYNHMAELGIGPDLPTHFPSSLEVLTSDALHPENILTETEVHYPDVLAEYND